MTEDVTARLRSLEESRLQQATALAALTSDVHNQGELVRAVAPLVNDLSTVRGVANAALEETREVKRDLASRQDVARSTRWQLIATVISVVGLFATLVTLVFFILQYAGAGG